VWTANFSWRDGGHHTTPRQVLLKRIVTNPCAEVFYLWTDEVLGTETRPDVKKDEVVCKLFVNSARHYGGPAISENNLPQKSVE
jgi:hypothetical protein